MSVNFRRNADGTTTGTNEATGFTVTSADAVEVERLLYEDAGLPWRPPPEPPPVGHHRFGLAHVHGGGRFDDPRYDAVRADPPVGCVPEDWGWFALRCERPGADLLDAVGATVEEIRRRYGLLMDDVGIEKVYEWFGDGRDGHDGELVGQLLLMALARAGTLGYGAEDLVRFLRRVGEGTMGG